MRSGMIAGRSALSVLLILGVGLQVAVAAPQKGTASPSRDKPAAPAREKGSLSGQIARIATAPGIGGMRVGVRIVCLGPKPGLIYDQNADQPFKPASNQKIVTTAAAMNVLAADFKYRTILASRGDDLVIIGAGDPSIGDPQMAKAAAEPITKIFHDWAAQLKAKGITEIKGNLLFDDYVFEQEHIHPHWKRFNLQDWYTAPVGGLNFNDNCVDVLVKPTQPGAPAEVTLVPGTAYLRLDNRTKTASKGQPNIQRSGADPRTIVVSGAVSRGNSDPTGAPSVAIVDPGEFFAGACRTALAAQGIEIKGETQRRRIRTADGTLPADLKLVAVYEHKLGDVLWRVNKSSLNMFAEAILKTMGAYAGREDHPGLGSYETGRTVVQMFLSKLGVRSGTYFLDDGSGLSHENRVTPAMLASILQYMDRSPRREEWWDNLAVPGEKVGTLKRRMKNLTGHVFAKTGSIEGVSALSGYVRGPGERVYAFSILCNDTHRSKISAHTLQDEICQALATWDGPLTSREE